MHIKSLGKFVVWTTMKFCFGPVLLFLNLMGSPSSPFTSSWETLPCPIGEDTCRFLGEEKLALPTHPISRVSILVCCVYICDINYYMQFLGQRVGSVSLKKCCFIQAPVRALASTLHRHTCALTHACERPCREDTGVCSLAEATLC